MCTLINKICSPLPCFKPQIPISKEDIFFEKIEKIWPAVPEILKEHSDFCKFLYTSRLIFTMVGYKNSLDKQEEQTAPAAMREVIYFDQGDGEPCLWKEGRWVRWNELKEELEYDAANKEIVSQGDPDKVWNYYYNPETGDSGLCPSSRYGTVHPVYQLTEKEMRALGINRETPCVLQTFTSNNFILPKLSHVGLRIINQNGYVYSLGLETPNTEIPFPQQKIAGNYDATISSLDYDEFAKFKQRRITTFLITEAQFQNALERITTYSQTHLRFNRAHQNCATYTTDIIRTAGITPPVITTPTLSALGECINDAIPYAGPALSFLGRLIQQVTDLMLATPVLGHAISPILYLARKINTIFSALLLIALGARHGTAPKRNENQIDNKEGLTYFDKLYSKWTDIFDEERCMTYSVKRFVDWQLDEQGANTAIFRYEGPQFYIAKTPVEKTV